jgi:RNA polymerase sigma factor (sigma-70 family)
VEDRHGLKSLLERLLCDRDPRGNSEAWNAMMERLRPLVRAWLAARLRQEGDASDLAQEVQVRVLRGFNEFRGDTVPSFLAWVSMIAARVLSGYYRSQPPQPKPISDDLPDPMPTPDAFDSELIDRVLQAVERLPEPRRRLIRAFYFEGRSCVEIAREMNRTPDWVRVTKLDSVRKLHEMLGELS